MWEALGLKETIQEAIVVDRSGSTILEETLRHNFRKPPVLGSLGLKETIVVAAWYIWWQRRSYCKGEHVASPSRTAFAILGLALNYGGRSHELWAGKNQDQIATNLMLMHAFFS
jgi:hypothetical protein